MTERARSWWGWGWADEALDADGWPAWPPGVRPFLPLDGELTPVPEPAALTLPPPRVTPPPALADCAPPDPRHRAGHTYGKAYRDVVRALRGDLAAAPDLVAHPRDRGRRRRPAGLGRRGRAWRSSRTAAAPRSSAGSSAATGPGRCSAWTCAVTGVVEVDPVSRAARVRGGTLGPDLEDGLRPHGLTLRHFPQSFEFSTLGGWIATRAGGHYATGYTHIDDLVESMRVVTPAGISRVPAGARVGGRARRRTGCGSAPRARSA